MNFYHDRKIKLYFIFHTLNLFTTKIDDAFKDLSCCEELRKTACSKII